MEGRMDRRQRKTREAIFKAFTDLLAKKHFNQVTVGEVIARADVGRATFYAHFETKDFLLKELCEELFCHLFDVLEEGGGQHRHIFECDTTAPVILHLLQHLQKNDNQILELLAGENNELFLRYFKENLRRLVERQARLFEGRRADGVPEEFWLRHIVATLVETIRWWIDGGVRENPEAVYDYFLAVV